MDTNVPSFLKLLLFYYCHDGVEDVTITPDHCWIDTLHHRMIKFFFPLSKPLLRIRAAHVNWTRFLIPSDCNTKFRQPLSQRHLSVCDRVNRFAQKKCKKCCSNVMMFPVVTSQVTGVRENRRLPNYSLHCEESMPAVIQPC